MNALCLGFSLLRDYWCFSLLCCGSVWFIFILCFVKSYYLGVSLLPNFAVFLKSSFSSYSLMSLWVHFESIVLIPFSPLTLFIWVFFAFYLICIMICWPCLSFQKPGLIQDSSHTTFSVLHFCLFFVIFSFYCFGFGLFSKIMRCTIKLFIKTSDFLNVSTRRYKLVSLSCLWLIPKALIRASTLILV